MSQYSAFRCALSDLQNNEKRLISNDLRFCVVNPLKVAFAVLFHTARHTYATLSLALGTDIITIKNVLGHKQESTTMRYTKVVNPLKEQAAKRLSINTISQNTEQYEKGNF